MSARRVWTRRLMGTVFSVHLIGHVDDARADASVQAFFAEIDELERIFSPFLAESEISRMRRGELLPEGADPRVGEVAEACRAAEIATGGRFSATWRGGFDPTGYVKGWAVDRAGGAHLAPLLELPGAIAVGVGAGGDIRTWTAPGAAWSWHVGIADPRRPGEVLATVDLVSGAVATSGVAERGAHIIDPRTGEPALGALSVTVVAGTLALADVWATAGMVAGTADLSWTGAEGIDSGFVVPQEGAVHRGIRGVELEVVAAA